MIQIGDTVRFLNEQGEGTVTRIIDDIAYVLIEDGFEIPSKISQLVCIKKGNETVKEVSKIEVNENLKNNYSEQIDEFEIDTFEDVSVNLDVSELTNDFYFAFTTTDELEINKLQFYLINDTDSYLVFCVFIKTNDGYRFIDKGSVEPNTKFLLSNMAKEELVNIQKLVLQGIYYNPQKNNKGEVINKEIKIKTLYLLNKQYYKETEFFDERAFLISIIQSEKNVESIFKNKIEIDKKETEPIIEPQKNESNTELLEVDLHIYELVEDTSSLTATEMLNIQLNHFRKKMEEAIMNKSIKRVVFIHGVGNGTLKLEIRRILNLEYAHYDYQDASFKEYGYGATMVILRK